MSDEENYVMGHSSLAILQKALRMPSMYAGTCGKNGAAADNLTFYPEKYIDKNVQIQ